MSQQTPFRVNDTRWDFLEPAMNPNHARTKHGVLAPAGAGLYVRYPKGQVIRQKTDGTNEWAKIGVAGYAGPPMIIKQPLLVNDAGNWQLNNGVAPIPDAEFMKGSIDAYYQGFFRCEDIVSAGGTNEVQTLTLDAAVDGGTFTFTFGAFTTAAIAWNATAAVIEAALVAAVPSLLAADITSAGIAGGPHTFTFVGNYAGSNALPLVLDPAGLTDGGVAFYGTTAVVETTPGAGLLTGVGRIVQGTSSVGIFELGAATPA